MSLKFVFVKPLGVLNMVDLAAIAHAAEETGSLPSQLQHASTVSMTGVWFTNAPNGRPGLYGTSGGPLSLVLPSRELKLF